MDQESRWNKRYGDAGDEYLFGTAPNHFLERRSALFKNGRNALALADGEGRNSVWLAQQGLEITAVEISPIAVEKARRLAALKQVEITFQIADILAPGWPPSEMQSNFDWVVGIFIQFVGPPWRDLQFARMKELTRSGGCVVLQGYTPKQLDYRTGGPSEIENLYTPDILRSAFCDWSIEELIEYEEDVAEGSGHSGKSALIGMVARKPVIGGNSA